MTYTVYTSIQVSKTSFNRICTNGISKASEISDAFNHDLFSLTLPMWRIPHIMVTSLVAVV